jgi:hypothetical protein
MTNHDYILLVLFSIQQKIEKWTATAFREKRMKKKVKRRRDLKESENF